MPVGDVDRDALLALGAQTVGQPREIAAARVTERGETRADDRVGAAAMEDRKRVGYF